jgi:hypothetical protein
MNFDVVTDIETTFKYCINRTCMLEMFNGAENGKGALKDDFDDMWTFEKTAENGEKSRIYFKNEVLADKKLIAKK